MGYIKRHFEEIVETNCTCGTGCDLDQTEHDEDCKAQHFLSYL